VSQYIEQALVAQLNAIPELATYVGSSIYKSGIPQTHQLDADGPALVYAVDRVCGHVLTGSDGTAIATAKMVISALGQGGYGIAKLATEAMWNGIDGAGLEQTWGDGSCVIMSVVQQDESDEPAQPKDGSDQWIYGVRSEYAIKYRVTIPTLS
jgi:hypothetical protein